ncbi:hypothetical protein PRIPAC_78292, partial [Pristionchus pacificus]|uniref:Uncharacterized protein n=1 Tax=Pristionchus pacificus TaxID=54126 RepID=A0A2A6CMS9_PRIPA
MHHSTAYEAVCVRIEQGADFDKHPLFAHRSLVGSRRRHRNQRKSVFDVTSSGANELSVSKMRRVDIFELCQNKPDLLDSLANGTHAHFKNTDFFLSGISLISREIRDSSEALISRVIAHAPITAPELFPPNWFGGVV